MGAKDQLIERLNKLRGRRAVIVGIGNTLKGDDGIGPVVCEKLKGKVCAEVIDAGTVPENYIQPIIKKSPQCLLVIDAVDFGASPGEVRIFGSEKLSSIIISTHTLSPRVFVDMIRGDIEVEVYFIGIQPAQTTLGQPISAEVSRAGDELADVLSDIFAMEK